MKRRRATPTQKLRRRMRRYRTQTLKVARRNPHERWMKAILAGSGHAWKPQYIFGSRIFDFFCPALGVAIEVDGPDHSPDWDHYRDADNWWSRRVVVLRVRNHNADDASRMLAELKRWGSWADRFAAAGHPEVMPQSGNPVGGPRIVPNARVARSGIRRTRKASGSRVRRRRP